jgi:hypothetical protein
MVQLERQQERIEKVFCTFQTAHGTSDVVVNRADDRGLKVWNVHIAIRRNMADGARIPIYHPLAGATVKLQSAVRCTAFLDWLDGQGFEVPSVEVT